MDVDKITKKSATRNLFLLATGLAISAFLVIIVLILTILKESELFWHDAGGYPIWLRQSILSFYYPATLSTGALLAFMTFYGADVFRKSRRGLRLLGPCIVIWCLYGLAWGLCVADNVEELFLSPNAIMGDTTNFPSLHTSTANITATAIFTVIRIETSPTKGIEINY